MLDDSFQRKLEKNTSNQSLECTIRIKWIKYIKTKDEIIIIKQN